VRPPGAPAAAGNEFLTFRPTTRHKPAYCQHVASTRRVAMGDSGGGSWRCGCPLLFHFHS
jgi:hypothetical protein